MTSGKEGADPLPKLYLLPGMGCDSRIYRCLNLTEFDPVLLEWPNPKGCKTLGDLADKIIDKHELPQGALIGGVSMGGMTSVEIGRRLNSKKVLLISSAKTKKELPGYFRFVGSIGLQNWLPDKGITSFYPIAEKMMGIKGKKNRPLFMDMLEKFPVSHIRWAMNAVLNWNNQEVPEDFIHIHGTSDLVIPFRNIGNAFPIKGGTHFMLLDKGNEISRIIDKELIE